MSKIQDNLIMTFLKSRPGWLDMSNWSVEAYVSRSVKNAGMWLLAANLNLNSELFRVVPTPVISTRGEGAYSSGAAVQPDPATCTAGRNNRSYLQNEASFTAGPGVISIPPTKYSQIPCAQKVQPQKTGVSICVPPTSYTKIPCLQQVRHKR